MSLPQCKTPVWNQIKTISFAPPCSAFCSILLCILLCILICILILLLHVLIHTTPPLLHNSLLSLQPEINGHQVLQSEGTTHKLRPCPSLFRHAPTLLHHAPSPPSRSDAPTLLCHILSRSVMLRHSDTLFSSTFLP